jgi:acyl-CoA reductase-like NAD-dependent aldehyde dehydrogenase
MDATPADVRRAFDLLVRAARAEPFPSPEIREDRLDRLGRLLLDRSEELVAAIAGDFGARARHETLLADVVATLDSVRHARRHVRAWMRPEPVAPHPLFRPSRAWVEPIPLGVVGIVAPWNYPVNLLLAPLAGALAAGDRALLKPSEATPRTAEALARAVRDAFTAEEVAVVTGGPDVARALTALPLDHLVFTGSTAVGRRVALAAAENLVPTTLELGGKSPVLIHPSYPVATAAERVAPGKLFNAGQTCIAPDYVLLPRGREEVFVEAFRRAVARAGAVATTLVSDAASARIDALLADAAALGARLVPTGPVEGRWRAPVMVLGAPESARVRQEEIFGPVLPLVACDDVDRAVAEVARGPRPLAAYVFDRDVARARRTLARLPCGGACVNDTLAHFAQEGLPFGGLGASGTGAYHGRAGFDRFSHRRSVLEARPSPARWLLDAPAGRVKDGAIRLAMGPLARIL